MKFSEKYYKDLNLSPYQHYVNNVWFIKTLDKNWLKFSKHFQVKKWGVIGAYHPAVKVTYLLKKGKAIDLGGPGWVALYSSIPFGEWKDALDFEGESVLDTPHFSFRSMVSSGHNELLEHSMTVEALTWCLGQLD